MTVTEKAGRVKALSGERPPSSWTVLGATCMQVAVRISIVLLGLAAQTKTARFDNTVQICTCPAANSLT